MLIHGFFSIFANKIGVNKFCLHPHLPVFLIVEAFKYQESNQHFGKICLEM